MTGERQTPEIRSSKVTTDTNRHKSGAAPLSRERSGYRSEISQDYYELSGGPRFFAANLSFRGASQCRRRGRPGNPARGRSRLPLLHGHRHAAGAGEIADFHDHRQGEGGRKSGGDFDVDLG